MRITSQIVDLNALNGVGQMVNRSGYDYKVRTWVSPGGTASDYVASDRWVAGSYRTAERMAREERARVLAEQDARMASQGVDS